MPSNPPKIFSILEALTTHRVDFIVVGGVCAVLNGAPITTFDVDIVHSRDDANIERLVAALNDLQAIYRHQPGRRIAPTASYLKGPGHQLLTTRFGALDVLGTIGDNEDFVALLPHCEVFEARGMSMRTLNLAKLIEMKTHANRDKDRMVLPILRQTLNERQRKP